MKKRFRAAAHVGAVDGRAVPTDRIVELSDSAAAYWLGIGKIVPVSPRPRRRGRSK